MATLHTIDEEIKSLYEENEAVAMVAADTPEKLLFGLLRRDLPDASMTWLNRSAGTARLR